MNLYSGLFRIHKYYTVIKYFAFTASFLSLLVLLGCNESDGGQTIVRSAEELNIAMTSAQPGAVITIANGTYTDQELVFTGKGAAEQPIRLVAETKGKVFLEGQSNLSLSGEHLEVEGLVFRNGFTPTTEVIAFRTAKGENCHHCRVTECVIDNYNPAERFESDYWVALFGKHNRVDHNELIGKRNQGVLMAVRLEDEDSRENFHRIDHNYFGYRGTLGSNGGETLRIGTSHYCMHNSNTTVEANYFDRCNGEVEIVSNKSGQNIFRYNTFKDSRGTLTIRHGDEVTIKNNFFFGSGIDHTGGIRVINGGHTIAHNYLNGITGYRFRSALTVMNGVPNSPLNRYVQVTDADIIGNVLVDCANVQFGVGSDKERSATPERTTFTDNVVYNQKSSEIFKALDDVSGITFAGNLTNSNLPSFGKGGFSNQDISLQDAGNGVMLPAGVAAADSIRAAIPSMATPENTGADWYERTDNEMYFGTGKTTDVAAGTNTLWEAVRNSAPGDVLRLTDSGEYLSTKSIQLPHPLTVIAAERLTEKPVLRFMKTTLFSIESGSALTIKGVRVDGAACRDRAFNAVFRTSRYSMINNYKLFVEDCDFTDLDINHSFNVVQVFKNTFADTISLRNSRFLNVSGSVLPLDEELDKNGVYNAQVVIVDNCLFDNIGQEAINILRGGRDESTLGPVVKITRSTFDEIGGVTKWNNTGTAIRLHGTQVVDFRDNILDDSKPLKLHLVVGDPVVNIASSNFSGGSKIEDNGQPYITDDLRLNLPEPLLKSASGRPVGTTLKED